MGAAYGDTKIGGMAYGTTKLGGLAFGSDKIWVSGAGWTPAELFAASEAGCYHVASPDNCFQNSDGTGACTVGDPVGYMADLSGNGHHAIQAGSARRPVLRQETGGQYYLEFDGIDDQLVITNSLTATSGPATLAFSGSHESTASEGFVIDIQSGRLILAPRGGTSNNVGMSDGSQWRMGVGTMSGGATLVGLARTSYSIRLNGSEVGSGTMFQRAIDGRIRYSGGNNNPGVAQLEGKFYGAVIRAADTTGSDLTDLETYLDGLRP